MEEGLIDLDTRHRTDTEQHCTTAVNCICDVERKTRCEIGYPRATSGYVHVSRLFPQTLNYICISCALARFSGDGFLEEVKPSENRQGNLG